MIVDAIVAFIAALVEPILFVFVAIVAGLANMFLHLMELVVGLFVHGYKTKRFRKRKWNDGVSKASSLSTLIVLLVVVTIAAVWEFREREVQFVAVDGHSLPFAEIVITTADGMRNERTDKTGNVEIPRFGLVSVSMIDARYVEKSWTGEEVGKRLVVERGFLGSALDKVANSFLNKNE